MEKYVISKRLWSPLMVRMVDGQACLMQRMPSVAPCSSFPCPPRQVVQDSHKHKTAPAHQTSSII